MCQTWWCARNTQQSNIRFLSGTATNTIKVYIVFNTPPKSYVQGKFPVSKRNHAMEYDMCKCANDQLWWLCFGHCFLPPQKSHVGMSVNKIRKKCGGTELSTVAKKLIKSWKKLLPGQWVGFLLEERARIVGLFVIPNHLKCRNCNQGDRLWEWDGFIRLFCFCHFLVFFSYQKLRKSKGRRPVFCTLCYGRAWALFDWNTATKRGRSLGVGQLINEHI